LAPESYRARSVLGALPGTYRCTVTAMRVFLLLESGPSGSWDRFATRASLFPGPAFVGRSPGPGSSSAVYGDPLIRTSFRRLVIASA
jgi:hypothetical protein